MEIGTHLKVRGLKSASISLRHGDESPLGEKEFLLAEEYISAADLKIIERQKNRCRNQRNWLKHRKNLSRKEPEDQLETVTESAEISRN